MSNQNGTQAASKRDFEARAFTLKQGKLLACYIYFPSGTDGSYLTWIRARLQVRSQDLATRLGERIQKLGAGESLTLTVSNFRPAPMDGNRIIRSDEFQNALAAPQEAKNRKFLENIVISGDLEEIAN